MKHRCTIRIPQSIREGWGSVNAAFSDSEQWSTAVGADYRLTATKRQYRSILLHNSFRTVVQIHATETTGGMMLDICCRWTKGVTVMLYTLLGFAAIMQLTMIVQMCIGTLNPSVPAFLPLLLGTTSYTIFRTGLYLSAGKIKKLFECSKEN